MTKKDFINEAFGTRLKGEKFHQELVIFEEANKNQLLGKNQGEDANHLKNVLILVTLMKMEKSHQHGIKIA
jgi:hypothetical protein